MYHRLRVKPLCLSALPCRLHLLHAPWNYNLCNLDRDSTLLYQTLNSLYLIW